MFINEMEEFEDLLNYRHATHTSFTLRIWKEGKVKSQKLYLMEQVQPVVDEIKDYIEQGMTVEVFDRNWSLKVSKAKLELGFGVMDSDCYELYNSLQELFSKPCEPEKGFALAFT